MIWYLILCRSLTYAQRTSRLLERGGISSTIMRSPQGVAKEGCSYCVKVSQRRWGQAIDILKKEHTLPLGRVYTLNAHGEIREVANDLF